MLRKEKKKKPREEKKKEKEKKNKPNPTKTKKTTTRPTNPPHTTRTPPQLKIAVSSLVRENLP